MNTSNIFDRLSRKIHHHSDMEPHESDSGPPFGEVEPLNFHDEESVVHTVLEPSGQHRKRKRTARSFVPSAAPRWAGANCWLCLTTFRRAT